MGVFDQKGVYHLTKLGHMKKVKQQTNYLHITQRWSIVSQSQRWWCIGSVL